MRRLCKLQINQAGSWRDMLRFDLNAVDSEALQIAAVNLMIVGDPNGQAKLRITTDDSLQNVLIHWDAKKGWTER